MLQEVLTVTNPKGIHARPSAMIVDTAGKMDATIQFLFGNEKIDATNIMDVLSMGAACGAEITVTVDGGDEQAAMQRMKEIFASNFGDD
jgi:phosphocarrier protein